jgi:hypothetical protein
MQKEEERKKKENEKNALSFLAQKVKEKREKGNGFIRKILIFF